MNDKTAIFLALFNAYFEKSKHNAASLEHIQWQREIYATASKAAQHAALIYDKIYPNDDEEIYCGDYVILSIDGGPPVRYFLTRRDYESYYDIIEKKIGFPTPINGGSSSNSQYLNVYTDLGKKLIGEYVGSSIEYEDSNGEKHTAKILLNRRTAISVKMDVIELIADENNNNINNKR